MEKPKHNHHRHHTMANTKHKHLQRRSTLPIHQRRKHNRSNTKHPEHVPYRLVIHGDLPGNGDICIHTKCRYAKR